jgi:dTDP-4-dehydrorhamnose 3,5-epimerase-like enzyme
MNTPHELNLVWSKGLLKNLDFFILLVHQTTVAGYGAGLQWNDPDIADVWPFQPKIISDADKNLPLLANFKHSSPR